MKSYGVRYHCVFALVAACVGNIGSAQAIERYLYCTKVVWEAKQVYISNVWRDDGADTDTDFDAGSAFDKFVKSKRPGGGDFPAVCMQDKSASVAKSEEDKFAKDYVGKGYTVVNTSWTYVK